MDLNELKAAFLNRSPVISHIPGTPEIEHPYIKAIRIKRNGDRFINCGICAYKNSPRSESVIPRQYLHISGSIRDAPEFKIEKRIEKLFLQCKPVTVRINGKALEMKEIDGLIIKAADDGELELRVFFEGASYLEVPASKVTARKNTERVNYKAAFTLYSELLPMLRQPQKLNEQRKTAIRAAVNDGVDFSELFKKVAESDFLIKECKPCDFDWIIKPSNRVKILEGRYENKEPTVPAEVSVHEKPSYDIEELEKIE